LSTAPWGVSIGL